VEAKLYELSEKAGKIDPLLENLPENPGLKLSLNFW
jgi:hypothetical protein